MSLVLEEKLREAACCGNVEAVLALIRQNVDVNSKNSINGWTALHWACKRGHEEIVRLLMSSGANPVIKNIKGETACNVCPNSTIASLLGDMHGHSSSNSHGEANVGVKFTPNYLRNPPLSAHVDVRPEIRTQHTDLFAMPTTVLPTSVNDELILKVRVAGSNDPDFIEVEIPRSRLTYLSLLHICCEELEIKENQVERIRKLPDTRLRRDSDVKRLTHLQSLEFVLSSENYKNCYQSISTCKDQIILY